MPETVNAPDHDVLNLLKESLVRSTAAGETLVDLASSRNELLQHTNQTGDRLLSFTSTTAGHTERQTAMAQERTALTREQTRLSTRSTELANIRTELARESTTLAGQRTDLGVARTEMARRRTSLAEGRTGLAQKRTNLAEDRTGYSLRRTDLAEKRNDLATLRTVRARTRTHLSLQRSELARERTYLAFVRTGLALLTFGIVMFRYFGVSWWSLFDLGLVVASLVFVTGGIRGYVRSHRRVRTLDTLLATDAGLRDLGAG